MMTKYRYKVIFLLIFLLFGFTMAFSGCINSPTQTPIQTPTLTPTPTPIQTPTPKPIAFGYITTIALDKMKIELVDIDDNYDNYEVESNVGTVSYRGYTYQTHRITLLKGNLRRKTVNNVIEYELSRVVKSRWPEPKAYGYVTTITFDMETELIKFSDNYDKYELEENINTVGYRGYTYQTHRLTLWKDDSKRVINNVVAYNLIIRYM